MTADERLRKAMNKYGDMIFRMCLITLKNHADAEDVVQETFLIYFRKMPEMTDSEHEKAWLITVAANKCRDTLRFRTRHSTESEDVLSTFVQDEEDRSVLEALMELPEKFSTVLTLHYIEGFKVKEIAEILGATSSAVKMRLAKGRKLLAEIYRKEFM